MGLPVTPAGSLPQYSAPDRSVAVAVAVRPLRIALLGPLTVTVDGSDVAAGGPTQQRLAATLAVAALSDAAVPINDLIDAVYQNDLPPRPRRSLATMVWRLRRQWGTDAIVSDGYTYRLVPATCTIDVADFEDLLNQGRALARCGEDSAAVEAFRAALNIWRGPGEPDPAIPGPDRSRLVELRLGAMDNLAQSLVRSGRQRAAIELLEQIVAVHPDWEHSQALLIDCHLDGGDATSASRVLDGARRVLVDQGVEPGRDLERVLARLSSAAIRPVIPAQATVGSRSVRPGPDRSAPAHLIGRDKELGQVIDTVAAALDHRRPVAVVISGEPGIGKSTLARTAVARICSAGTQPLSLTVICDQRSTLPYAPLAVLVPDTAEESPALSGLLHGRADGASQDGPTNPVEIHAALRERVRTLAGRSGLVLLIEDLHWAPRETVDAIAALLAEPLSPTAPFPLAVVTTSRERTVATGLASVVSAHLRLPGLDLAAVTELIGAGDEELPARRMHALTGGNPLYLHQIRQAGYTSDSVPPHDLEEAIESHLRHTPAEVIDVLEVAAVAGNEFDLAMLAALTGSLRQPRPTWLERLTAAAQHGLIQPDQGSPGRFTFVHSLIREHLYRRMPAARRTTAHAELGRALDRIALGRPYPVDLLVHHYTRGWPETTTREVVGKLGAAARTASAQLDFAQAAAHYRTALDHLAMDPAATQDREVAETIGDAAKASAAAGDLERANTLYTSAQDFAENAQLPLARVSAALGVLTTEKDRRVRPQIAEYLASALDAAVAKGVLHEDPELSAEAVAAVQMYRPYLAGRILDRVELIEPALSARLHLAVWEHRSVAGQLDSARRLVDDPSAEPVGAWLRLWVSEVASGLRALDDPPACRVPLHHADGRTRSDLRLWRITAMIAGGRIPRAHTLIERALAAPRHPDPAEQARRQAGFLGQRAYLQMISGDADAALQSADNTNPTWTSRHPVIRRYTSAQLLASAGRHEQARELCDELLDEINEGELAESDLLPRLMVVSGACLIAEHHRALATCLRHLLPHRGEHATFHFGHYWGVADRMIGDLQIALGDLDNGIQALRDALAGLAAVRADLFVPSTRRALAAALLRHDRPGDRQEAAELRRAGQ